MAEPLQPPRISRKILPPMWVGTFLVGELAVNRYLPVMGVVPAPLNNVGFIIGGVGVALMLWAVRLFRKADTGLIPFSESTALVVTGPYRFTRNPMYVAMTLVLLGAAVWFGTLTPFAAPPMFVVIITQLFIIPEEAHMERAFGASYLEMKKQVRRWL